MVGFLSGSPRHHATKCPLLIPVKSVIMYYNSCDIRQHCFIPDSYHKCVIVAVHADVLQSDSAITAIIGDGVGQGTVSLFFHDYLACVGFLTIESIVFLVISYRLG